ncbi:MAG: PASTA domain-containing protein [Nocardioidaceae bacterium]
MSDDTLIDLLAQTAARVPDSDAPLSALLRDGRHSLRRRRAVIFAGSVVAILAVAGVGAAVRAADHGSGKPPVAGGPAAPPAGMKWSGIGTRVVAVPQNWTMVPGLYCGSRDGHDHVTIVQAGVVVSCPPDLYMPAASLVALSGDDGAVAVEVELAGTHPGVTQQLIEQTRTTLPAGWLAVPAGGPSGGVGPPNADEQARALEAAGFEVDRVQEPSWDDTSHVRTEPEIGAPARLGTTVTVYEQVPAPAAASLTGRLLWVGGPAPGHPRPRPGTIHVVGEGLDKYIPVWPDGRWSFEGPAGTFTVTASSPGYLSANGVPDSCQAKGPVTLQYMRTTTANVYCQLR